MEPWGGTTYTPPNGSQFFFCWFPVVPGIIPLYFCWVSMTLFVVVPAMVPGTVFGWFPKWFPNYSAVFQCRAKGQRPRRNAPILENLPCRSATRVKRHPQPIEFCREFSR